MNLASITSVNKPNPGFYLNPGSKVDKVKRPLYKYMYVHKQFTFRNTWITAGSRRISLNEGGGFNGTLLINDVIDFTPWRATVFQVKENLYCIGN